MFPFKILNKNWLKLNYLRTFTSKRKKKPKPRGLLDTGTAIIPMKEIRRFIVDCLQKVGASKENAEAVAMLLSTADYRGSYSHGINRLEMCLKDITTKTCDAKAVPKIIKETGATAWVDGNNALGAVVGNYCMKLAICMAKTKGVGWVSCKKSNHFGMAAVYPILAMKEGLLGLTFSNSSPVLTAMRGIGASLGSNPIALAAPAADGDEIVFEMATSAVSYGQIEVRRHKGIKLPRGWSVGEKGQVETDPDTAIKKGSLMPLGGEEHTSGYKGFGLAMAAEVLSALLGGALFGKEIRIWGTHEKIANIGHCFVAVDFNCFNPDFKENLKELLDMMRCTPPVNPDRPVIVAGDVEREHMKAVDTHGGLRYFPTQMEICNKIAKNLGVKPLRGLIGTK